MLGVGELASPAFCTYPAYEETDGGLVAKLAEDAGFAPDAEQRLALDLIFATGPGGRVAALEAALCVGRQNLKTGVLKMAVLAKLFLQRQRLIVWSAHEFATSAEAFRDLRDLIDGYPNLGRKIKSIRAGHGDEAIELVGGQRVLFKTRTRSGGRGLTGDTVILDEAMYLQASHMGSLFPTLSARPDPQVLYGGSAGLAESAVWRGVRKRGRAGDPSLVWIEWCDDLPGSCAAEQCMHTPGIPGCRLDEEARWFRANPTLGKRITVEFVRGERRALPPEEFGRERLGWWDDPDEDAEELLAEWAACADADSAPPGRPVYGVDASPGSRSASIVAAIRRPDGHAHVEVVEHRAGVDWVLARCKELRSHQPYGWVIDANSPVAALDWKKAGFTKRPVAAKTPSGPGDVTELAGRDLGEASEAFTTKTTEGRLRHLGDQRLLTALQGAGRRDIGDGLWAWSRKKSGVDISPLVAATGALWGLETLAPAGVFFGAWR